jgi:hypothetical protein
MAAFWASDRDIEAIFLDEICKVLLDGKNAEMKALSLTLDTLKARQKERREQERRVAMVFPLPVTNTVSNIPVVESPGGNRFSRPPPAISARLFKLISYFQ